MTRRNFLQMAWDTSTLSIQMITVLLYRIGCCVSAWAYWPRILYTKLIINPQCHWPSTVFHIQNHDFWDGKLKVGGDMMLLWWGSNTIKYNMAEVSKAGVGKLELSSGPFFVWNTVNIIFHTSLHNYNVWMATKNIWCGVNFGSLVVLFSTTKLLECLLCIVSLLKSVHSVLAAILYVCCWHTLGVSK